ncbi:hypothetical protein BUE80_DR006745 [Diplocarpon rosae]|nr:hypothetical protein BUE80_DR006745 [Diplocarpon rosae]
MLLTFSISQTAGSIIAVSKAEAAALDLFASIDAPKPSKSSTPAPEVSVTENILFTSVTSAYPRPHVKD